MTRARMASIALSLATLGEIDRGAAQLIIDKAINEAVADVEDRGDDEKERTVVIKLKMKQRENGDVETHVEAAATIPSRRTASTVTCPVKRGNKAELYFQEMSPDNPDQESFPEMERNRKNKE